MISIFLRFFNLSMIAGWMVLAVLLLRLCLKKAPRWITCLLWGLVALRLLVPFAIESPISLIPTAETVVSGDTDTSTPVVNSGVDSIDKPLNDWLQTPIEPSAPPSVPSDTVENITPAPEEQTPSVDTPEEGETQSRMEQVLEVAAPVWLVGIGLMLVYELFSVIRVRRRVLDAVLLRDNVWQSDRVSSPFIFGLFRPRIYVPYYLNETMLEQVLLHERAHLHRRDHWIKPFAFTLLAVYWYNPLLWIGYVLLCRDIEVACDERVVRGLDEDARRKYATVLLQCGVERRSIAACPLAFGEVSIKQRIKSVLNYRKPLLWVIIASLLVCSVAAVCLLTVPNQPDGADDDSGILQQNLNAAAYIPYDIEQSAEYNNVIGIYNSFLSGLIPVQGDATYSYYVTDIVRGSNGKSGIDSYALADVNQDNIPELFIRAMSEEVLGVVDGKLTCWYSSGGSVKVSLLENGALFTTSLNSPDYHTYITFDKSGTMSDLYFYKGATDPVAPVTYTYNGDDVTKEEWESLTAPYFAQAEKTVELQWFKWSELTTLIDHFLEILQNEQTFVMDETYFNDEIKGKAITLSRLLEETDDRIGQYTLVDMDEDGAPELIVQFSHFYDNLLIRNDGDNYYGYFFGLRSMNTIRTDGSFNWAGGAGYIGCSRLRFSGDAYEIVEMWHKDEGAEGGIYFVGGEEVTKEEYLAATANQAPEVTWVAWETTAEAMVQIVYTGSDKNEWTEEQWAQCAAILEQRLTAISITDFKITTDPKANTLTLDVPRRYYPGNLQKLADNWGSAGEVFFCIDEDGGDPPLPPEGVVLDNSHILSAKAVTVQDEFAVELNFTAEGAEILSNTTKRLTPVRGTLAIWMDWQIVSTPQVSQPITDGKSMVTGFATWDAAVLFATKINAGRMPIDWGACSVTFPDESEDTTTEPLTLAEVDTAPDGATLYVDTTVESPNYTLALTAQEDVTAVRLISVYATSSGVGDTLYTLSYLPKGETLYVSTYVNDATVNRGVVCKDKNNILHAYAFVYSGKDGSVKLQPLSKTEDPSTYVATEADKAAITAFVTAKENNGFLQSNYTNYSEISLSALFYDGAGVGTYGIDGWSEQEMQDVLATTGWDEFHNPPLKIKRTDANEVIKTKLAIYHDPTEQKMYEAFHYVSKYDAFYAMHGDSNYAAITVKDVQYDSEGYFAVTYTAEDEPSVEGVVTLTRTDTGFRFRSNERGKLVEVPANKAEYTPPKSYSGKNVADATGVPYSTATPKQLTNQMARELLEVLIDRQREVEFVGGLGSVACDESRHCDCWEWCHPVTDQRFKTLDDVRNFVLSVYTADTADWWLDRMLYQEWNLAQEDIPNFHEHDGVLYYHGGGRGLNEDTPVFDTTRIVSVYGDIVIVEVYGEYEHDEDEAYDSLFRVALCKTADGWRTYSNFMAGEYL